jgi:DNA invertase Pin-like site-specific DNA recombinase
MGEHVIQAILYAAKSTNDERGSIPTQLNQCREAAEAEGREVVAAFRDEAASGYHGSRGRGLADARELAKRLRDEGREVELWVFDPDRLARGSGERGKAHLAQLYWWSVEIGAQRRAVQNDHALRDPIYATIEGQRTHGDSKAKAGHVSRGMRAAAERGDPPGGICPDGYQVIRWLDERGMKRHRWEKDPERWEIYKLHFDLALKGYSDRAIVLELDKRGYETNPRKANHRPRPFDATRVRQTLANPLYAGLRTYRHRNDGKHGEVVAPGNWPAVVSPEDFYRLREERARRSHRNKPAKGRPPQGYVLARVATCGECGSPMDVVTCRYERKDGSRAKRYVCRIHRTRPQDCSVLPLDATVVDAAFVDNLSNFLGDVEAWRERLTAGRAAEVKRLAGEVERAERDVATVERRLEKQRRRYAAALDAGDDNRAAAIEEAMAEGRTEREHAQRREEAASRALRDTPDNSDVDPLLDFFAGLKAELAGRVDGARGDLKKLNIVCQEYFDRVELTQEAEGVRIQAVLSEAACERIFNEAEALVREVWPEAPASEFNPEHVHHATVDPPPLLAVTAGNAPTASRTFSAT